MWGRGGAADVRNPGSDICCNRKPPVRDLQSSGMRTPRMWVGSEGDKKDIMRALYVTAGLISRARVCDLCVHKCLQT